MWLWPNCFTSLCVSLLICKIETIPCSTTEILVRIQLEYLALQEAHRMYPINGCNCCYHEQVTGEKLSPRPVRRRVRKLSLNSRLPMIFSHSIAPGACGDQLQNHLPSCFLDYDIGESGQVAYLMPAWPEWDGSMPCRAQRLAALGCSAPPLTILS